MTFKWHEATRLFSLHSYSFLWKGLALSVPVSLPHNAPLPVCLRGCASVCASAAKKPTVKNSCRSKKSVRYKHIHVNVHAHGAHDTHSYSALKNSMKWWRIWEKKQWYTLMEQQLCFIQGVRVSQLQILFQSAVYIQSLYSNKYLSCVLLGCSLPQLEVHHCTIDESKTRRLRAAVGGGGGEERGEEGKQRGQKGGCFPARHWFISPVPKTQNPFPPTTSTYKQKACPRAHTLTHTHIPLPPCQ